MTLDDRVKLLEQAVIELQKITRASKYLLKTDEPISDRVQKAIEAIGKCKRVIVTDMAVLKAWEAAFPSVDLAGEILKCDAWAVSTKTSRTVKGWTRTLNTWIGKTQDKSKGSIYEQDIQPIVQKPTNKCIECGYRPAPEGKKLCKNCAWCIMCETEQGPFYRKNGNGLVCGKCVE